MLLFFFIAVILVLTVAAIFSLRAERCWLIAEYSAFSTVKNAASSPFRGADDLIITSGVSPQTRIAKSLRNAEASAIMSHLPERHRFPYLPTAKDEQRLLTLRNISITCTLIFGLAGTFLKLTSLIPTGSLQQLLNYEVNNTSEGVAEFLKGIEGGLSIAFTPSIVGILAMILVLSVRHWFIENYRQSLTQDFHDFVISSFARAVHSCQDPTMVAAATANAFFEAAKCISASTRLLDDSLREVKLQANTLNGATLNLKSSTDSLKTDLGGNSPLVGSIGALFEVASPLADRYQQIVEHLSKLEQSLAKHNGEVAKTFDGVLSLAVAAKESLPKVSETISSTFKPIFDSAAEWSAAGTRWENALTKAMSAESKRIEVIATALTDASGPLPSTLRELKSVIEDNAKQNDCGQRHADEMLSLLQSIDSRLKTSGTEPTATTADQDRLNLSELTEDIKSIRKALKVASLAKLDFQPINSVPDQMLSSEANLIEQKGFSDLISRIDKQQDAINKLVVAIQAATQNNAVVHEQTQTQLEKFRVEPVESITKTGLFGRIFGNH
jgi:hypothetical protein